MFEDEPEHSGQAAPQTRRILKVRLRQDHVIRLHEMRILQGKSIAALLEDILEDYLKRSQASGQNTTTNSATHVVEGQKSS